MYIQRTLSYKTDKSTPSILNISGDTIVSAKYVHISFATFNVTGCLTNTDADTCPNTRYSWKRRHWPNNKNKFSEMVSWHQHHFEITTDIL